MTEDHSRDAVSVEVRSTRFEPDTDRAREAAMELAALLRREFPHAMPPTGTGGSKGDPVTIGVILLALITSGAAVKALECVKSWIEKDPTDRELRIQGTVGEKHVDLTVSAKNIGDDQVAAVIGAIARRPAER